MYPENWAPNEVDLLVGLTRQQVVNLFGLKYNDINHQIWMYRICLRRSGSSKTKRRYLYITFDGETVTNTRLRRFKKRCEPR